MAKLAVIVVVLVKSASCAFFDPTDVEDPLSLFWYSGAKDFSLPSTLPQLPTTAAINCMVSTSGSLIPGVCQHKTLCLLSGGQINVNSINTNNNCPGAFSTCCTRPTICAKQTKSKISYFTSDTAFNIPECEFRVEAMNDNVCQVRLDFEYFQLSPSERVPAPTIGGFRQSCAGDFLSVTPNVYNVPLFCGNNDGQHAYVHLYQQREVSLKVHLVNRTSTPSQSVLSVPNPRWRIKITQLECPANLNFWSKYKYSTVGPDFALLAPEGATQYFTQPSGTIRSFGFNGEYLSGLHYSIAFKPTPYTNCLWFNTNYVRLRHAPIELGMDGVITNNNTAGFCLDYLFIPDFQEVSGDIPRYGSQYCAGANSTQVFYTLAPPPYYVYFHSEPTFIDDMKAGVHAFDIQYQLTSCDFLN